MRRRVLLLARREIVVFGMLESDGSGVPTSMLFLVVVLVVARQSLVRLPQPASCCVSSPSFSPVLLKYLLRRVSSFFCNSWSATMLNE